MSRRIKTAISDLAYLGGTPCFERMLHVVHASTLQKERFLSLLNGIFDRGYFTNDGPLVQELEQRIADRLGARHCIAICNGTIALQIAVRAMGMRDEVIVPSFTFIATAHALQWQGIRPVFCDIDPETHTLNPASVEKLLTPHTRGIVGVHLWGTPCDVEALSRLARSRDIPLLFDAAHAFGASHNGLMVGNFGNAEVFSFHATKLFHTFEGGAVVTNDSDLATQIGRMRNFGFIDYDRVETLGINGKMSEVSAAMGLAGLETLDKIIEINRERYYCYARHLKEVKGITLKDCSGGGGGNYQYIVIELDSDGCVLTRDQILALLHAENIFARRYFYPGCHRMEPYRTLQPDAGSGLRNTEIVAERVIVLPTGERVDNLMIEQVCEVIRFVTTNAAEIAARLK
jgi:dTDP-4-amino-4,6-dideoxygalactose transaminase